MVKSQSSRRSATSTKARANRVEHEAVAELRPVQRNQASNEVPGSRLEYVHPVDDVELDPNNPRLSPDEINLRQDELIRIMLSQFRIEDIAESIISTGYQPFDPIIGYRSKSGRFVVQEGNRRMTALKLLLDPSLAPLKERSAWITRARRLSDSQKKSIQHVPVHIFQDPYDDIVDAYIGFRHVTGVLQWPPEEKAKFIAQLVDRHAWSYREIAERLGSYARHVERHYVAYQVIRQAEEDGVPGADNMTIGTLLRALQAGGVSEFLGVEYPNDPKTSRRPVPDRHAKNFRDFVKWAFGTDEAERIVKDSRQLTQFGKVLASSDAIRYLRSATRPTLDRAWLKSGGQQEGLVETLYAAADRLEESAALTPQYSEENAEVADAVNRCALFLAQILRDFPHIKNKYFPGQVTNAEST